MRLGKLIPVPAGYKMQIRHIHDPKALKKYAKEGYPAPLYVTTAELYDDSGDLRSRAIAYCSHKDVPNRKGGRYIAHNRAMKYFTKLAYVGVGATDTDYSEAV